MLFSQKLLYECSVFIIKFEILDAFCSLLPSLKVSRYVSYRVYGIVMCIGSAKGPFNEANILFKCSGKEMRK
jgi:hypothetical protein